MVTNLDFFNGLCATNKSVIDVAVGGALMSKIIKAAYELLKEQASYNYQWFSERSKPKPVVGVLELDHITSLTVQLTNIIKQLDNVNVNSI